MGTKYLDSKAWQAVLKKNKIKDPGIAKALTNYWECQPPAYEGRLDALAKILTLAKKMQKDKAVIAAKEMLEYVKGLIKETISEQKRTTIEKKKYEAKAKKSGAKEVNLQFVVRNFLQEPMLAHKAFIEFKAPGFDKITLSKPIKGGVVAFKGIELMPVGTMRFIAVSTGGGKILPTGVISYKLKGEKTVTFLAQQKAKLMKVKAKSATEMAKKAGLKGSVGLEFQILKVGGETYSEKGSTESRENEVEWEIAIATAVFDLKKK